MVSTAFTCVFLGFALLTLVLFGLAEAFIAHRNKLAALAAASEGIVFALMAWLFYNVNWGGTIPAWFMALLPLGGTAFSFNMAYKRLSGKPL